MEVGLVQINQGCVVVCDRYHLAIEMSVVDLSTVVL